MVNLTNKPVLRSSKTTTTTVVAKPILKKAVVEAVIESVKEEEEELYYVSSPTYNPEKLEKAKELKPIETFFFRGAEVWIISTENWKTGPEPHANAFYEEEYSLICIPEYGQLLEKLVHEYIHWVQYNMYSGNPIGLGYEVYEVIKKHLWLFYPDKSVWPIEEEAFVMMHKAQQEMLFYHMNSEDQFQKAKAAGNWRPDFWDTYFWQVKKKEETLKSLKESNIDI